MLPLPRMDPCYLCEIVAQPASWNLLDRTDLTITVLNGRQFEIGQCMVLPLRHAPTLIDLTEPEEAALMAAAKRLATVLIAEHAPDGAAKRSRISICTSCHGRRTATGASDHRILRDWRPIDPRTWITRRLDPG